MCNKYRKKNEVTMVSLLLIIISKLTMKQGQIIWVYYPQIVGNSGTIYFF